MVSGLLWNIRGVGNTPSRSRLKSLVLEHNLLFVALMEPMLDSQKLPKLCKRLGMDSFFSSSTGVSKIWVLWKSSIHLSIFHSHDQVVTLAVHEEGRLTAYLSFLCICQVYTG